MATPRRFHTYRRQPLIGLLMLGLLAWRSGVARAEPPVAQPADTELCPTCIATDEHRSGIYLRMSVGVAPMQLHNEFGTASRLGGAVSFALGYYVQPNFALSLGAFGSNAYTFAVPTGNKGMTTQIDARSLCLGVSLTYYFPLDFYLGVTPGIGWLLETFKDGDSSFNNAGFALDVIAGKEWWLAGAWALGTGAQFTYTMADGRVAGVDYAWSLGALFTVTWN
jgi:hypothetical protein